MFQGVLQIGGGGPTHAFGSRVPDKEEPCICAPVTIGKLVQYLSHIYYGYYGHEVNFNNNLPCSVLPKDTCPKKYQKINKFFCINKTSVGVKKNEKVVSSLL